MNRKFFLTILTGGLMTTLQLYGQKPVIIENTMKVAAFKEEIFYYGFAAGDKLIFNLEETNKRDIQEIEITELPSSLKLKENKVKKIENRTFDIAKTGIYKFRIANTTILPRNCKITIQRIPANESTQDFNTTVYTRTVNDTSYINETETYIDMTDTVISNLQDRTVRIQSPSNTTGNKANFSFLLPPNSIAWSYYIYTDVAGKQVYEEAVKKLNESLTETKFSNYGPLAAEAFGATSYLKKLDSGKEIDFWIVEGENANLFMTGAQFRFMKKGKIINDFSKMNYRDGSLYFCFSRGASTEPATITVKITALQINEALKLKTVQRISVKPKTEMYLKN